MRDEARLRRPHVWRRDDERGIGAERGGAARLFDGLGGVGLAGAREHGNAPGDVFDRGAQQGVVFHVVQGGRFARRTGHDHALRAAGKLEVEQATPGVEVECAIGRERRGQRGNAAGKLQGGSRRKCGASARFDQAHFKDERRRAPPVAILLAA